MKDAKMDADLVLPQAVAIKPLPLGEVLFTREKHLNTLHEDVIRALMIVKQKDGLTDEMLARRLGKSPRQIDGYLANPDGWSFELASDLLTAAGLEMTGLRIKPRLRRINAAV